MELKSDNLKMFINTLWYDNVDDYDFLKLKNVLPLTIYFQRLHVFLIVWKKYSEVLNFFKMENYCNVWVF